MTDLKKIFDAEAKGLSEFLCVERQGCMIPIFQRSYSWRRDNVSRLFEDVSDGLARLAEKDEQDSVRFLGTIIAIAHQGAKVPGVKPPMTLDLPAYVMTIIDGQQRLCTLIAINILLHDELRRRLATLAHAEAGGAGVDNAVLNFVGDYLEELFDTFLFKPKGAWYPRVINQDGDRWARAESLAHYESPIARLIWHYLKHTELDASGTKVFMLEPPTETTTGHEALRTVMDVVVEGIAEVAKGKYEYIDLPDAGTLAAEDIEEREFWSSSLPEELRNLVASDPTHIEPILRLMAFGQFLNKRMAVTAVTTSSDDYAFDIFEALNTTGQPLTAIETFRPKVVEAEDPDYKGSVSEGHLASVESYLSRFENSDTRHGATTRLLIPFALLTEGKKLEGHLNSQRWFLRSTYDGLKTSALRHRFTGAMASVARFLNEMWDADKPAFPNGEALGDDEVAFCLKALKALRHEVVIAVIARYHVEAIEKNDALSVQNLRDAIKAVTACSFLWRAARGTSGIDSMYRSLVRGDNKTKPFSLSVSKAAAHPLPTIDELKAALVAQLKRYKVDLTSRDIWVAEVAQQGLYTSAKTVAKFLLLAAHQHGAPDPAGPGLIHDDGRSEPVLMNGSAWESQRYATIEHVAPQSQGKGKWSSTVYKDRRTPDTLGNLVLIPGNENQVLSDRDWDHKRALLSVFASKTKAAAAQAIADAEAKHFTISGAVRAIAESGKPVEMCEPLAAYTGAWDAPFIRLRSDRLSQLAWKHVAPWLGLPG